jgi:drug/metabolite transporter (DMT)-like permease
MTLGRTAVAAAALLLLVRWQRLPLPAAPAAWLGMAGVALFGNGLPYFLIAAAEQRVESGLAAILITTTPLITMVAAHFLTRDEPLTARRGAGLAVGFAGVVVLVGPQALAGLGGDLAAQALLLLAAAGFAASVLIARRMPPLPVPVSSFGATLVAAVLLFPPAVAEGHGAMASPSWTAIAATVGLGLVSTAGAALLYFALVRRTGATFVASANYLVPLIATGLGITFLGERPGWDGLAALALILAGTWLANARR